MASSRNMLDGCIIKTIMYDLVQNGSCNQEFISSTMKRYDRTDLDSILLVDLMKKFYMVEVDEYSVYGDISYSIRTYKPSYLTEYMVSADISEIPFLNDYSEMFGTLSFYDFEQRIRKAIDLVTNILAKTNSLEAVVFRGKEIAKIERGTKLRWTINSTHF